MGLAHLKNPKGPRKRTPNAAFTLVRYISKLCRANVSVYLNTI